MCVPLWQFIKSSLRQYLSIQTGSSFPGSFTLLSTWKPLPGDARYWAWDLLHAKRLCCLLCFTHYAVSPSRQWLSSKGNSDYLFHWWRWELNCGPSAFKACGQPLKLGALFYCESDHCSCWQRRGLGLACHIPLDNFLLRTESATDSSFRFPYTRTLQQSRSKLFSPPLMLENMYGEVLEIDPGTLLHAKNGFCS